MSDRRGPLFKCHICPYVFFCGNCRNECPGDAFEDAEQCQGHAFIEISGKDWRNLPDGKVNVEGQTFKEFLGAVQVRYEQERDNEPTAASFPSRVSTEAFSLFSSVSDKDRSVGGYHFPLPLQFPNPHHPRHHHLPPRLHLRPPRHRTPLRALRPRHPLHNLHRPLPRLHHCPLPPIPNCLPPPRWYRRFLPRHSRHGFHC